MAKKQYKLNLASLLNAIDRRDFNWLMQQPEDAIKEFSAFRALRFATSFEQNTDRTALALWLFNERVNNHLFDLGKHPDLLFRLLASCGMGRVQRKWLQPTRRSETNKAMELLREHHPFANNSEIEILLSQYTRESFRDFIADCGKSDKELAEIIKAYDAITTR
jgi:hypothetical protein